MLLLKGAVFLAWPTPITTNTTEFFIRFTIQNSINYHFGCEWLFSGAHNVPIHVHSYMNTMNVLEDGKRMNELIYSITE